MKSTVKTAIALLALSASAWMATAQDNDGPPPQADRPPRREGPGGPGGPGNPGGQRGPGGPGGQGGFNRDGQRPPPPPLMAALDANRDGVIDEAEIANASAALKKLDKNGDGKLTLDELRPPRMEGAGGPGGPEGFRGPRGQNGPGQRDGLNGPGGPGNPRGPQGRRPDGSGGQPPPEGDRPQPRPQPEN